MNSQLPDSHPSGDGLLSIVTNLGGSLGSLAAAFPGKSALDDDEWIKTWFRKQIESSVGISAEPPVDFATIEKQVATEIASRKGILSNPVRLISVEPRHFRGFRQMSAPINVGADLVVIGGPNSSGKTSFAEALEFLITGVLQRRTRAEQGNPKELENCIQSQLRPVGEETWVEAVFATKDGSVIKVRRTLLTDYGALGTSKCTSQLQVDGTDLSADDEITFLDGHFGSSTPLLMQHTLGDFIRKSPKERRAYFESLLRMDEITALIEHAGIGQAGLSAYPSSHGSAYSEQINVLNNQLASADVQRIVQEARSDPSSSSVDSALLSISRTQFECVPDGEESLSEARAFIEKEQEKERRRRFPILGRVKPRRAVDKDVASKFSGKYLTKEWSDFNAALSRYQMAKKAAKALTEAEMLLAKVLSGLVRSGTVNPVSATQPCPLCETPGSLKKLRVDSLLSFGLATAALDRALKETAEAWRQLTDRIKGLEELLLSLVPPVPAVGIWTETSKQLDVAVRIEVNNVHAELLAASTELASLRDRLRSFSALKPSVVGLPTVTTHFESIVKLLPEAVIPVSRFAAAIKRLETLVDSAANASRDYQVRRRWLELESKKSSLVDDLLWDKAKKGAQTKLDGLREVLMAIRQCALETQRAAFSDGISEVWNALRSDRFSFFKDLHIPPPSGKGYPITIEVRATLDDNKRQVDVDALRVFSESQTNVLGIAAFVTRARLSGHGFVLLDDPVQSMDEDHFRTFASGLLPALAQAGIQAIVLTHNSAFEKDISWANKDNDGYVTIGIRHSRRTGCNVDEGTRRVSERLDAAQRNAEEGRFDEAWKKIRLAIERLYTLVKIKTDAKFDPSSWHSAAAEDMWNSGVGDYVEEKSPGAGSRLKDILSLSAAGAHDKAPRGETDIANECTFLRELIPLLKAGN